MIVFDEVHRIKKSFGIRAQAAGTSWKFAI